MSPGVRAALLATVLALVGGGAAVALTGGGGSDDAGRGGPPVAVDGAWAAAADTVAAVYLTIDNPGDDDRLVDASTDVAGRVSVMGPGSMGPGADVDPGEPVDMEVPGGLTSLAPGGTHVMLEELARPLEPGEEITLELTFSGSGTVGVPVQIVDWDQAAELATG